MNKGLLHAMSIVSNLLSLSASGENGDNGSVQQGRNSVVPSVLDIGRPSHVQTSILLVMALVGFTGVLLSTTHGIGLEPDSQFYIAGARSLTEGHGYSCPNPQGGYSPIVVWPPAYSLVLSLGGVVNVDLTTSARILGAGIFATNVFLVGWLVRKDAPFGFWPPVLAATLILTSTDMLNVHIRALSEPLFILAVLLGMLCLQSARAKGSVTFRHAAAVLLGISAITRFAGPAFVVAGAIAVAVAAGARERIRTSAVFLGVAGIPLLFWLARNWYRSGSLTGREVEWFPWKGESFRALGQALSCWLVPETAPDWLRWSGLALVLLFVGLVLLLLLGKDQKLAVLPRSSPALLIAVASYLAFLVLVMTLIDPRIPVQRRLVLPMYPILVVTVFATVACLKDQQTATWRPLLTILSLVGVVWFALRAALWFGVMSSDAQGLASRRFRESGTLAAAKEHFGSSQCLYANNVGAVYFNLGRAAYGVPTSWNEDRARTNGRFAEEAQRMYERMVSDRGIVVWLFDVPNRRDARELGVLEATVPLVCVLRAADGMILGPASVLNSPVAPAGR